MGVGVGDGEGVGVGDGAAGVGDGAGEGVGLGEGMPGCDNPPPGDVLAAVRPWPPPPHPASSNSAQRALNRMRLKTRDGRFHCMLHEAKEASILTT